MLFRSLRPIRRGSPRSISAKQSKDITWWGKGYLLAASRTQREITFTPPRNIFALLRTDASGAASANGPEVDAGSEQALRQQAALAGLALFHYLGFVRAEEVSRKEGEMAVLTKKDDLHVVRTGETVEDHVVVKAIPLVTGGLATSHSLV